MSKTAFRRTLKWKAGDVFAIPLADGSFGFGQSIAPVESWAIDFALFSVRASTPSEMPPGLAPGSTISCLATWRQAVTAGHWNKVGNIPLCLDPSECPNQRLLAEAKGIGTTSCSITLIESFLSAFHGVLPWNLHTAHDFDSFLLPGQVRPSSARALSLAELALYQMESKKQNAVQ